MALTEEGLIDVPGVRSEWVRLPNGARAHYSASGSSGPAVILLHGAIAGSSGLAGFRFMLPFLGERGFRVYAPDRPGFGLADTREEYWPKRGWMSYVDFVEQFAEALCLDQFFISGNSNGAMCAAYYVVNHPERVPRFILIATGGLAPAMGQDPAENKKGIQLPRYDGTKEAMRAAMEAVIYRNEAITDDLLEMRVRSANMQKDSQPAAMAFNRRAAEDPNLGQMLTLKGRLDSLTIPALYIHGLNDTFAPVENAYYSEKALPRIQFFYPDECGHQGQTDQPDLFNQFFLEFFRDGKISRETADKAGVSKHRMEIPELVEQKATVRA